MEYVIVKYPEIRGVLIDDKPSGNTNKTLMAEEGHHEFKLDGEPDYTPLDQVVLVQYTDPDNPMKIIFSPTENGGQNENE
jgi:hypothetical protein